MSSIRFASRSAARVLYTSSASSSASASSSLLLSSMPSMVAAAASSPVSTTPRRSLASLTRRVVTTPAFVVGMRSFSVPTNTQMFCRQCEQTENGSGCQTVGICGKTPDQAALQELIVAVCKSLAVYESALRTNGIKNGATNALVLKAMFSTLTNVNFDAARLSEFVRALSAARTAARARLVEAKGEAFVASLESASAQLAALNVPASVEQQVKLAQQTPAVNVAKNAAAVGDDVAGLLELATYGLKGLCAYFDHANALGCKDDAVFDKIYAHLASLACDKPPSVDTLVGNALDIGGVNLRVTQLLEDAHKASFGAMEPSNVRASGVAGKAILVSGHDIHDLKAVLEYTEGKGVNVYTHGELLPANAYPELKKHKHLIGNYGSAWQNQKLEFAAFPGAILMTSNCIIQPMRSYKHRIFTTSAVGYEGVAHVADLKDKTQLQKLVDAALAERGFTKDEPHRSLTIGYGKDTLLGAAGAVIGAIDKGDLKNIVFIGGCDGTETQRNYFAELAGGLKDDAIILTAGCAKYRFNSAMESKKIGPFPKVLDVGQCNDISGAIAVASALASHYKCSVNDLPLSFAVSWLEQKAVAQLLTCLHLGIKGIKLGPRLPAWVSPSVLSVLVKNFALAPTTSPAGDFPKLVL